MTSSRPYLIRALYDWISDNNLTPYLVVSTEIEGVVAPTQYAQDGQIVLNVSAIAVQGLALGNEAVEFKARFAGKVRHIYAPIEAVLAIFAKENGRGMVFSEEDLGETTPPEQQPPPPPTKLPKKGTKPHLKLVKK